MAKGVIRIDWFPREALDGMRFLKPLEELAYRRIIDMLYVEGGFLPDDDEIMAEQTRTFSDWPSVKSSLIRKEKISVRNGEITNDRCTKTLTEIQDLIDKSSAGGKKSAEKRRAISRTKREGDFDLGSEKTHENVPISRTKTEPSQRVNESSNQLAKKDDADDNAREAIYLDDLGWAADRSTWFRDLESSIPNFDYTSESMFKSRGVISGWHEVDKFEWQDVALGIAVTLRNSRDPPKSWKYFSPAIARAYRDRTTATTLPTAGNDHDAIGQDYRNTSHGGQSRSHTRQVGAALALARRSAARGGGDDNAG